MIQLEELKTPCFIFDEIVFHKNIEDFQNVLDKYFKKNILSYSFKTNSLPYILAKVRELGCYAETVSDREYQLALKMKYPEDKIVFNGPIKGKKQFIEAFEKNSIINIDSFREIEWLEEMAIGGKHRGIGIRVNVDLEALLPHQTSMGEEGGRFGFDEETGCLSNVIKRIKKIEGIDVVGLHMHVSSRTKSQEVYQALTKRACEIVLKEEISLQYLDIGGGFFGGADGGKAYENYVKTIYDVLKSYSLEDIMLIVEPGASVIATAVDYLTKVIDIKETNRNRFVVTNGSRLHVDPFFNKTKYSYSIQAQKKNKCKKQILCGYTCMENDRFMKLQDEIELISGDYVRYHIVGAYTMCFNSLFIEYLPRVYGKKQNTYQILRDLWGVDEYVQKCKMEVTG